MSRSVVVPPRLGRQLAAGAVLALTACGGPRGAAPGGAPAPAGGAPETVVRRGDLATQSDPLRIYQGMGLLANGLPMPVVASIQFLPGPAADTAYAVVAMSIPSIAMTFTRDGDKYRGGYEVVIEARRGEVVLARAEAKETVRVASFRETQRTDESVVFQQVLPMPAGDAIVAVQLRDAAGPRAVTVEKAVAVPRFAGRPSAPIVALEATPRTGRAQPPELTASPRQTVQYGVDDVLPLYVESTDTSRTTPVVVALRNAEGNQLWRDSVRLTRRGALAADVVRVPLPQLGIGVLTALSWSAGSADTSRTSILVNLGDDIPVASFDEMLGYLRFYASAAQLRDLRASDPQRRAQAWVNFLRTTDPISSTPQHEGLRDYFRRIRFANERFREDAAAGWSSDRGAAYVAFGEPDQVLDQGGMANNNIGQRGRMQAWDYVDLRIRLIFVDQSGFGRWRFTVQSAADFDAALRRKLNP
jgi:GWxTD domain-containing protein